MSQASQHLKVKVDCFSSTDKNTYYPKADREHLIYKTDGNDGNVFGESYSVPPSDSLVIPAREGTEFVLVSCSEPLRIYTHLSNISGELDFGLQTVFSLSTTYSSPIRIENTTSDNYVPVTLVRLTNVGNNAVASYQRQYTLGRLERIFRLDFTVASIEQLRVTDVTLQAWENNQIILPSPTAGNKYRVCDSDGTPNTFGNYIMLLNDLVTQQNLCGNLKINVSYLS